MCALFDNLPDSDSKLIKLKNSSLVLTQFLQFCSICDSYMWHTYKTNLTEKYYTSFHDIRTIKATSKLMINKQITVKEPLTSCRAQEAFT